MMGGMGMMGGMQVGAPAGPSELFSDADEDEDGSLDETEAQTLAEMISQATDEEVDVEQLFATYDEDGDGVLSEEETRAALEANRPEGPPPPPPGSMMTGSRDVGFESSNGIANYMNMASLGSRQDQATNMFAMFGDGADDHSAGTFFSVDQRI
jgi:Ca2+-binding EF-hand superfamily protein